ncbi:unnamed protein product [Paramecium octaurelia]|uniref:Uncharacterized protein n=1 Tax=Paramecium octaurelia TaxID=43137 RepID=A0A8S1XZC2_PAROT|nr:unnamed protein product [Paramecium octaurelia]
MKFIMFSNLIGTHFESLEYMRQQDYDLEGTTGIDLESPY